MFKTERLLKGILSHLFKGCWWISTSQRIQTNYASSPGKAKLPLWASVKLSLQWLSWEDSRCHYFWPRMEGERMWGPGCTGHSWVGSGWIFSPNECWWIWKLCHPSDRCYLDVKQCLMRDSHLSQPSAEIWPVAEKCETFYPPQSCVIWILCPLLRQSFQICSPLLDFTISAIT